MHLSEEIIEEVKNLSLFQVAEDWGIELCRAGRGKYMMLCPNPDHDDRNLGSCYLIDDGHKNSFHCYACNKGGDTIELVKLVDRVDFVTAVSHLATRYNINIGTENDQQKEEWKGLRLEEYKLFGLQNIVVEKTNPFKETKVEETGLENDKRFKSKKKNTDVVKYSLKQLAKDSPDIHDEILISKFWERFFSLIWFAENLKKGDLKHFGLVYDHSWENVIIRLCRVLLKLLGKGVTDKTKLVFLWADKKGILLDTEEIQKDYDFFLHKEDRTTILERKIINAAAHIFLDARKRIGLPT